MPLAFEYRHHHMVWRIDIGQRIAIDHHEVGEFADFNVTGLMVGGRIPVVAMSW